jgi:eukaryotic-like serine/threonine-protein kinase
MPLPSGTLLSNRYRIVSILGQGGMGAVYRADDEHLGIPVAVKENLFLTEEYSRQFQREARILASLRHPGLPHVADYFVLEGQGQYLVMDYIEGEDLRQRMERAGPLPEREAILIGISVCDALNFLHNSIPPIIHRDLKPGNIKVTADGQAVLVDFGLAKVMEGGQATMTGARAMTPGYSPPEQYGTSHTDARSDIYSLGATLYASLTGTIPEDGLNRMTGKADLTDIRTLCPRMNRRLADSIERALAIDPEDRFQNAEEFRLALIDCGDMATYFRERPTLTPPPTEALIQEENAAMKAAENIMNGFRRPSRPPSSGRARRKSPRTIPLVSIPIVLAVFVIMIFLAFQFQPDLRRVALAYINPQATPTNNAANHPGETPTVNNKTPQSTLSLSTTPGPTDSAVQVALSETPSVTVSPSPSPTPLGGSTSEIAFVSERTGVMQIWLINSDGKNLHQVTNMPNGACQPSWSPDGMRLAFISPCVGKREAYEGSSIYLINVDGSNLMSLPSSPEGDFDPTWSPDGKKIAFTSLRPGHSAIFTMDLDTQQVKDISQSNYSDSQPSWSFTSHQIAFVRHIVNGSVWVMSEDGTKQSMLSVSGEANDFSPTWSRDGSLILYSQMPKGSTVPGLVGVRYEDRLNPHEFRIPGSQWTDVGPIAGPSVSADGIWIAYESWPDGTNHDIYIMTMDGTKIKRVTTDPGVEFSPVWRPSPVIP